VLTADRFGAAMTANAYTLPEWELLLKAVVASPDDDLPRLVAADWLDEHGEPERAEFIRVQVERAKADRPELGLREKALLNNPLLGPIWAIEACPGVVSLDFGTSVRSVGVSGAERVTFRRGFPYRVACAADEWVRYGGGIIPRQPVRELTLTRCEEVEPARWWQTAATLRPLAALVIDTPSLVMAAFVRDRVCPGVRVHTPDGPFDDEIIADGLIPPPFRRPTPPSPLAGPEDLPGRNDIPF
jgi:uncharacterized protein (TIGR02996 family)